MNVIVTGSRGQLGRDVCAALLQNGHAVYGLDLPDVDITDARQVRRFFDAYAPDAAIHCAAFTSVDRAQSDPDTCARVNVDGTRNIAEAAQAHGAKLVYISSDYVYGGCGTEAMTETYAPRPVNVYGKTKYEGELQAKCCSRLFVVRTSWVFGLHGDNFVKTILCLSETQDVLRVVCDQIGSPTFTEDLAELLCAMIETDRYGVYNASNEGFCSWHEFAEEILRLAGRKVCVWPVLSAEYASAACRPLNSRMSKQKLTDAGFARLPQWKDALVRCLRRMKV